MRYTISESELNYLLLNATEEVRKEFMGLIKANINEKEVYEKMYSNNTVFQKIDSNIWLNAYIPGGAGSHKKCSCGQLFWSTGQEDCQECQERADAADAFLFEGSICKLDPEAVPSMSNTCARFQPTIKETNCKGPNNCLACKHLLLDIYETGTVLKFSKPNRRG